MFRVMSRASCGVHSKEDVKSLSWLSGHSERIPTAALLQSHNGMIHHNGVASPDVKCGLSSADANQTHVVEEYNGDLYSITLHLFQST